MIHRGGGGLGGLGDGPIDRENDTLLAIRGRTTLSRSGSNLTDENGPREAAKQLLRPRSALGNLTNGQHQSSASESVSEPPAKVQHVEKVEPIETMNRLPTDPDFEPPSAAERLFEAIDSGSGPHPAQIELHDDVPDTPPNPEIEEPEAFETPLTFLDDLDFTGDL